MPIFPFCIKIKYSKILLLIITEHFKIGFKGLDIAYISGETSYSAITAQVGSSEEPKHPMCMAEVQELAQIESTEGVRLKMCFSAG